MKLFVISLVMISLGYDNMTKFTIDEIKNDLHKAGLHWERSIKFGYKGVWENNTEEGLKEYEKGWDILEKYRDLCNDPLGYPEGDDIVDYLQVIIKWEEKYRK